MTKPAPPTATQLAKTNDVAHERIVLGTLIADPTGMLVVNDLLAPEDFYLPHHTELFKLLKVMVARQQSVDLVSVTGAAYELGINNFGGAPYIAELYGDSAPAAAVASYAGTVRDRALRRRAAAVLHRLGEGLELGSGETAEDVAQRGAAELAALSKPVNRCVWSYAEAIALTEADAVRASEATVPSTFGTGFPPLDECLGGGMRAGDLVVIGGRPSMGKSALATAIATFGAQCGGSVLYASCEPRRPEWTWRQRACETGVPIAAVRDPKLRTQAQWDRLVEDEETAPTRRLSLFFRPGATLEDITHRARSAKLAGGLDVLIVDHLHLMTHRSGYRNGDRHDLAIAATTKGLKDLAGQLECAVVLLAQLNRGGMDAQTTRARRTNDGRWWDRVALPSLTDLRESGAIEQDADVVLFPMAACRAGPNETQLPDVLDDAAVIAVAKQRNGPKGRFDAAWDGACACYRPAPKGWSR